LLDDNAVVTASIDELRAALPLLLYELKRRGALREVGNAVGSLGEVFVQDRLGLALEPSGTKAYDATDSTGTRYQIKTRVQPKDGKGGRVVRKLGITESQDSPFDVLLFVRLKWTYELDRIWHIPITVVRRNLRPNGALWFNDKVANDPDVSDWTDRGPVDAA
jgi:hypothetical protein